MNLIGDPKYIGPGVWYIIHLKAKEAINEKTINEFIDLMYMLAEKFSCVNCRKHINEYISTHPFRDLINLENEEGVKIGMFKWAWLFHNAVNTRIHKPLVDWQSAWDMYNTTEVCNKGCGDDIVNPVEPIPIPTHNNNNNTDRKSKLAQGYFLKVGTVNTLKSRGVELPDNIISYRM